MDEPQDDLKWFGEGFDGFPKRLSEDTVQCVIYILNADFEGEAKVRERLRDVEKAAKELCKSHLREYIWQRDEFQLELTRDENQWCLRGKTNYGDSVADEWVVVFLLRELSRKFKDAWIRVYDTDGEFLLIEAANALPRWLNPEVAENRVWVNGGRLLIVPQFQSPAKDGKTVPVRKALTTPEALSFLRKTPSKLTHSPLIEAEAFYRIRNHPGQISENQHHAIVTVPRRLAYLLRACPQHVSPAIEAFYLRDPIALKPLQATDPAALLLSPTDPVTVSARFARVSYAQLKSQVFRPPGVWAAASPYTDAVGEGPGQKARSSVLGRTAAEMWQDGMKLACGFEMLLRDPQNQDKRAVRELKLLLEDLDDGVGGETLPTDAEIEGWPRQEDSEAWLDVDFDEFQQELDGKAGKSGTGTGGFGDKLAQDNLRKTVERFEAFLNDDAAGAEGAEYLDDMDFDDEEEDVDNDNDNDSDSETEDKAVSFDEAEFARMMREMMGLPLEDGSGPKPRPAGPTASQAEDGRVVPTNGDEESEDDEIQALASGMEAELRAAGALDNSSPSTTTAGPPRHKLLKGKGKEKAAADQHGESQDEENGEEEEDGEDEDGEVRVDFALARNLLESLRAQAGAAGPAGNLMGAMGVRLPRDEEGDENGHEGGRGGGNDGKG